MGTPPVSTPPVATPPVRPVFRLEQLNLSNCNITADDLLSVIDALLDFPVMDEERKSGKVSAMRRTISFAKKTQDSGTATRAVVRLRKNPFGQFPDDVKKEVEARGIAVLC